MMHMWRLFSLKGFTAIINFGEEPVSHPNRKELASAASREGERKIHSDALAEFPRIWCSSCCGFA